MKAFLTKQLTILILLALLFAACSEEPELEGVIPITALDYTISQNPDDPNMIILESSTPEVIPHWVTPKGRSTKVKDTVLLPFAGSYNFIYGVLSGGGYVTDDTVSIELTTNNLSYVEDPLWDLLTGGVGNSKTWLLDLDADGVSKYFDGPVSFYGTDNGWGGECLVEGGDCWNWNPVWSGTMWVADQGDYGQMTFSLGGGAFLTANHSMIDSRGEESGTFFLDATNYTLSTTDATPLHSPNWEDCVDQWGNARVFAITEDYMQLGFLRKTSCEEAMLVFNYISKDFSDN